MPNDSANFNEVLQISIDVPGFKQGLDEITQLYEQFKASLEGQDLSNILNVGSFSGVIQALNDIKATIVETTSDGIQSFTALGEEISTVLAKVKVEEEELAATREKIVEQAKSSFVTKEQIDNAPSIFSPAQIKQAEEMKIELDGIKDKYEEILEKQKFIGPLNRDQAGSSIPQASRFNSFDAQLEKSHGEALVENEKRLEAAKRATANAQKESESQFIGEIANVTKFLLLWQAVGFVIQGISSLLASPFVALKSGVEYLEQTQKAANDLLGVIASNVKFSGDLSVQFDKAKDSANEVVKAFQDISIKDNIKVDDLTKVFKSFIEAGGAGVVRNLEEAVKITEQFSLAIKASGASAQSVRAAINDIPKFLNGTLQPTSKFLEVLALTPAEAKKLAVEVKNNQNLLDELTPRMQKYIDATLVASGTNEELGNRITLIKERLEGIAAGPIFETINGYLKQALEFFDKNEAKIESIASTLGHIANDLLLTLVANLSPAQSVFAAIAYQVGLTGINLSEAVSSARLLLTLINPFSTKAQIEDGKALYDLEQKRASLRKQELAGKLDPSYDPSSKNGIPAVLQDKITNSKENPSLDKTKTVKSQAGSDKEDFLDQVAIIKSAYEDLRETAEDSLKSRAASHKETAVIIKEALNEETIAYIKAAEDYKKVVANDVTIKPEDKPKINNSINRDIENFIRQTNKQKSALDQAANSEDATIRAQSVKQALDIEKEKQSGLLEIYRLEEQQGLISDRTLLDQEIAASEASYNSRLSTVNNELQVVAKGTVEYSKLIGEQDVLLQQSSNSRDANSLRSVALDEQIATRKRTYALELLQIESEQRISELQTNELVTGSHNILEETFAIRQKEIDAKREEIQIELQLANAKQAGGDASRRASLALAENTTETLKNIAAQIQAIRSSSDPKAIQAIKIDAVRRDSTENAANDVNTAENKLGSAVIGTATQAEIDGLAQALKAAKDKYNAITAEVKPQDFADALGNLEKQLFGFDLGDALNNAQGSVQKFAVGIEAAAGALTSITTAVQAYSQGQKQGGTLGGIGGLLQSGPVQQLAALGGPIVSGIVQGIGSALSFVGAIFEAQARKIAENIKKDFDTTVKALQQGSATIGQTLAAVTQERSDAISKLSGVKDGKEQLDKLLPSFDDEIASLKQQQQSIITGFNESLGSLVLKTNTFNDALSSAYTNWVDINKQVQDYVNAGGDAAKAAQFLSLSLKDIQEQNQEALDQGQQQAVQDAIHLNDLLQQKVNLEIQYNQQVFALQNSDSIERANNGIISRAQQLQQTQLNNEQQLANLNNEISLTTQKVTAEQQIFSISSDINQLHQQDNALTIASLDLQLAKYASIKQLVDSITTNASGITSLNTGVFANQGVSVGSINVNIQTPNGTIITDALGKSIGDSVYAELQSLARQGT